VSEELAGRDTMVAKTALRYKICFLHTWRFAIVRPACGARGNLCVEISNWRTVLMTVIRASSCSSIKQVAHLLVVQKPLLIASRGREDASEGSVVLSGAADDR
jgi:hypothetical protein